MLLWQKPCLHRTRVLMEASFSHNIKDLQKHSSVIRAKERPKGSSDKLLQAGMWGSRAAFPVWQRYHLAVWPRLCKTKKKQTSSSQQLFLHQVQKNLQSQIKSTAQYNFQKPVVLVYYQLLLPSNFHSRKGLQPLKTPAPHKKWRCLAKQWTEGTHLPERLGEVLWALRMDTGLFSEPAHQHLEYICTLYTYIYMHISH